MAYPTPDNITGIVGLWKYCNAVTNNWFSILFSFTLVIIAFMILQVKGYRVSESLVVSLFLSLIISSLMWAGGLLAGKILLIILSLLVLSVIYLELDR